MTLFWVVTIISCRLKRRIQTMYDFQSIYLSFSLSLFIYLTPTTLRRD
jgi:hypothetical protein